MNDQTNQQVASPSSSAESRLGIWLNLLIIYLRIIYPIQAILSFFNLYGGVRAYGMWMGYVWIELVALCALSVVAFLSGSRLRYKRTRRSVVIAMFTLVIIGPVWQAIDGLFIPLLTFSGQVPIVAGLTRVAISLVFAASWVAYLKFSKRVNAIYQ